MDALTSVEKAVDVLFALHGAAARSASPRSAARSGCRSRARTACSRRWPGAGWSSATRAGATSPGIALVALGLGALEREPLVARRARDARARGRARSARRVFLVGRARRASLVLDKAEGTGFLRAAPQRGRGGAGPRDRGRQALPRLRAGAAWRCRRRARALHAADAARARARARARGRARARAQGFAENRDEWIAGLSVVAAPVLARGELRGAVAVAAPSPRLARLGRERGAHARSRAATARSERGSRAARGRICDERSAAAKVWIDGAIVDVEDARIPVTDHGLLYGDGVFEGIRDLRRPRLPPRPTTCARLAAGARALGARAARRHATRCARSCSTTARAYGERRGLRAARSSRAATARSASIRPRCPQPRVFCIVDRVRDLPGGEASRGHRPRDREPCGVRRPTCSTRA